MAEIVIKLVNGELAGKTMQGITKEVNAAALALKKAEAGTTDFVNASTRLEQAKKLQADMKTQIDATSKASDSLKGSFSGILNQIPGFSQVTSVLGQAKGGVGGLTSSFGLLRGAIISTGIGALVIAVIALVGWFAKTDAGANMLSGVFKALGNVVDVLFSRLWNIGSTLKELFSDPLGFFKHLGEDMADAAVEGYQFAQAMDEIEDKARALKVLEAETEKAVTGLILQSKNVGLTYKERIDLLDKASTIEKKNHEEQLANAIALEKLLQADFDRAKQRGTDTDDLDQKLKDAQIARINLEKDSINLQEKIDNRRTALLEKQQAEQEKAHQAELKRLEERRKAEQKAYEEELAAAGNIEDLKLALQAEGANKEIAKIKLDTKRKIDAFKGSDEQIIEQIRLAQELQEQQIQAVKDKYAKQAAETDKKNKADQAAADKKAAEDKIAAQKAELQAIQDNVDHENFILLEQLQKGIITRGEYAQLTVNNQIKAYQEQLDLLAAQGDKETKLYDDIAKKIIALEEAKEAKIKKGREATFSAAVKLGQAFVSSQIAAIDRENAAGEARLAEIEKRAGKESGEYKKAAAELLKVQKENFEKKKSLEKKQIFINALAEEASIIKSAVEIGGVYGIIVGAALSAVTAIRAADAMKNVDAQTFRDGGVADGVLRGPSHAEGGIPIEVEGDEIIMTKGVFRNPQLRAMASAINVAGGGRSFAAGGPINPFENRAPISSGNSHAITSSNNDLLNEFQAFRQEVSEWQKNLKVINVMTAQDKSGYGDKINTLNKIKDQANV